MNSLFRDWPNNDHPAWLNPNGKSRIFSLKLTNVGDPLDADAIWHSVTGGAKSIMDEDGKHTNRRLLQALKAHCYTTLAYKRDVPVPRKFFFSDVIIWVSPTLWREADIENGEKLLFMSERFRYQHEQAFGEDQRFQNRPPNFCIMPMGDLPTDHVICQFGLGVFLPNKNDVKTASLSMMKQGYQPAKLPDWVFYEREGDGTAFKQITRAVRPSGLYADQRMLLLSHNYIQASVLSPYWLDGHSDGEIILNLNANKPSTYGDKHNITAEPPKRSGKQTNCYFHEPGNTSNGITLVIDRVSQNKVKEALRASAMSGHTGTVIDDGEESLAGLTNIDLGDQDLPDYIYQLNLVGIVLPRIAPLKSASVISHWELALNQHGLPITQDETAHWTIRAGHSDMLEWRLNSPAEDWQPLNLKAPLPHPETQAVHLMPAALATKQFAILPLSASATSIPLSAEVISVGRHTGESSPADFPLNALHHCSTLIYKDGSHRDSLDLVGLSAEHIATQLKGRKVQLQQLKNRSFILNKKGEIRETLTPKNSSGEIYPSERLIIGPLCFELIEEFLPNRMD